MQYKYLVLNHIPRCGGTSLKKSFFEAAKTNQYFRTYPIYISGFTHNEICLYRQQNLIDAIHEKTLMFIDHSPDNFIQDSFELEHDLVYKILTLRNPIDRLISHISFFHNKDINSISKSLLGTLIQEYGQLTISFLTDYTHSSFDITDKLIIAKEKIQEYNFIFKVEEQKLCEIFNDDNPFALQLPNYHLQRSNRNYNIKQNIKNYIYKYIKQEIELLEPYYEMDL